MLPINDFQLENIHFLDTKKNIIMDGNFTKISYSDDCVSLNSIYFYFPIEISKTEKMVNKNMVSFDSSLPLNKQLIKKMAKIEKNILEYYFFTNVQSNSPVSSFSAFSDSSLFYPGIHTKSDKKITNKLETQLQSGYIKLFKKNYVEKISLPENYHFLLKISGVWENNYQIGITYKFMEILNFSTAQPNESMHLPI
jgi:hypothetical protein